MEKYKYPFARVEIYNAWFIGLLGVPANEASAWILKEWGCTLTFVGSEGRSALIRKGASLVAVIFIEDFLEDPRTLALFSHEVLHACLHVLGEIGQGVDPKDHEHLAYMQQYVFQTIWERHKAKRKSKR